MGILRSPAILIPRVDSSSTACTALATLLTGHGSQQYSRHCHLYVCLLYTVRRSFWHNCNRVRRPFKLKCKTTSFSFQSSSLLQTCLGPAPKCADWCGCGNNKNYQCKKQQCSHLCSTGLVLPVWLVLGRRSRGSIDSLTSQCDYKPFWAGRPTHPGLRLSTKDH